MRKPEDICLICQNPNRKVAAIDSHYIPAWMLVSAIGPRNKEEAISLDFKKGTADVHYGKGNLRNTNTEITENSHADKYIFCPVCEEALSKLENKFRGLLVEKLRQEKYKAQFFIKEILGQFRLYELKGDASGFYAFLLSLVWRLCLRVKLQEGVNVVSAEIFEAMRYKLSQNLEEGVANVKSKDDSLFCFTLITHSEPDDNGLIIPFPKKLNPEIFWVNDFIILAHFEKQVKTDAKIFAEHSYMLEEVLSETYTNREDDKAKILVWGYDQWKTFRKNMNKYILQMYPKENILSALNQVKDKLA